VHYYNVLDNWYFVCIQPNNFIRLRYLYIDMERIRWTEKPITFQSLVDNSAIEKPALGKLVIFIRKVRIFQIF
jgi:hypothetical protein